MEKISYKRIIELQEPTKLMRSGDIISYYLPSKLGNEFLKGIDIVYPCLVDSNNQYYLCFFLKRPANYEEKSYKLYRLMRGKTKTFQLPVPTRLLSLFETTRRGKLPLVKLSIGVDEISGSTVLLLKKFNGVK